MLGFNKQPFDAFSMQTCALRAGGGELPIPTRDGWYLEKAQRLVKKVLEMGSSGKGSKTNKHDRWENHTRRGYLSVVDVVSVAS